MRNQRKKEQIENTVAMVFFTLLPSLFAYVAVLLFFAGVPYMQSATRMLLLFLAGAFSYLTAAICINAMIAAPKVQTQPAPSVSFSVAKRQLSRAYDYEKRDNNATKPMLVFCYVLAIPFATVIAAFGWLLFILYCCNKFLFKIKACARDIDLADSIILSKEGDTVETPYAFFRMLEYARASNLGGSRRSVRKYLCKAENLLDLWDVAREQETQDE